MDVGTVLCVALCLVGGFALGWFIGKVGEH